MYPETMTILAAEDYLNSNWVSDSNYFGCKMLSKMGWKYGGGIVNYQHDMTTNIQAYLCSYALGMGDTTNLHVDLGRSKTNNNFGGLLEALRM